MGKQPQDCQLSRFADSSRIQTGFKTCWWVFKPLAAPAHFQMLPPRQPALNTSRPPLHFSPLLPTLLLLFNVFLRLCQQLMDRLLGALQENQDTVQHTHSVVSIDNFIAELKVFQRPGRDLSGSSWLVIKKITVKDGKHRMMMGDHFQLYCTWAAAEETCTCKEKWKCHTSDSSRTQRRRWTT